MDLFWTASFTDFGNWVSGEWEQDPDQRHQRKWRIERFKNAPGYAEPRAEMKFQLPKVATHIIVSCPGLSERWGVFHE